MHGQLVCQAHGGTSPQALEAARRRLIAAIDPAIGVLLKLLDSDKAEVRLKAAVAILDRALGRPAALVPAVDETAEPITITFSDRNW